MYQTLLKTIFFMGLSLFLTSCGGGASDSQTRLEQKQLDANSALWAKSSIDTYQYTFKKSCFCPPEEDVVINIVAGKVESAFYTPSGIYLSETDIHQRKLTDVSGLFDIVQNAILNRVDKLDVIYDEALGYPHGIAIDVSFQMADEEITYVISDLM